MSIDNLTAVIDHVNSEGVIDATVSADGALIGHVSLFSEGGNVDTWGEPRDWASDELVTYIHDQPHEDADLIWHIVDAVSVAFTARLAEEDYQASKLEAAAEAAWDERRDERRDGL